jgi:hypothetical protein
MRSTRLSVCLCALAFGALSSGLVAAVPPMSELRPQPQVTAPAAPGVSPEDQKRIYDLKLKALDLNDPTKQLEIYREILKINPDDLLAGAKVEALTKQLAEKTDTDRASREEADEASVRRQILATALASGVAAVAEAKKTGTSEPLTRARQSLEKARKAAKPGDPDVDRLDQEVQAEAAAQRTQRIEIWAFIGLLVAGAVGAIVFYVLRVGHVLEMIAGPEPGRVFPLKKQATSIGALAAEVDWAIADPHRKISRRHCEILRSGRHFFVVDRSSNGTLLNRQRLRSNEPALLRRGDQIGLADDEVVIRFR